MSKLSDHTTKDGWKTIVFKMNSDHILNCINLWRNGLKENKYNKPQFIQAKISLYKKVLLCKRSISITR